MAFKLNPFTRKFDYYESYGDGSSWYIAEGPPSDEVGMNGDFYINTLTFDFYEKLAGTWY